jgi:hypothetical protein
VRGFGDSVTAQYGRLVSVKKGILFLPLAQNSTKRHHVERDTLYETEMVWGHENKEQPWLRKSWITLP